MKELNEEILRKCAKGLMFDMTDEQYELILNEFDITLEQLKLINDVDLSDVSPMTFPFECYTDFLREDEEISTISRDDALSNAKDVVDNQIRLPKVVG